MIKTKLFVSALLSTLIFTACNSGDNAIFMTIENEEEVLSYNLPDDAGGIGIVPFTDASSTEELLVAAIGIGKLYYRDLNGAFWDSFSGDDVPSRVAALAPLADGSGDYYLYTQTSDGDLIRYAAGNDPGDGTWVDAPEVPADAASISSLIYVDGVGLVGTYVENVNSDTKAYVIEAVDGAASAFDFEGDYTEDFVSATELPGSSTVWTQSYPLLFLTGENGGLYTLDFSSTANQVQKLTNSDVTGPDLWDPLYPQGTDTDGNDWAGVTFYGADVDDAGTYLVVSSLFGYVCIYDGSDWVKSGDKGDALSSVIALSTDLFLVGTLGTAIPESQSANGYWELDLSSGAADYVMNEPTVDNYSGSSLSDVGIGSFSIFGTNPVTLFALTVGGGIWRFENYAANSSSQWSIE